MSNALKSKLTDIKCSKKCKSAQFRSGYFNAMDDVMSFINSLDTSDMSVSKLRSTIYSFCIESRPDVQFCCLNTLK